MKLYNAFLVFVLLLLVFSCGDKMYVSQPPCMNTPMRVQENHTDIAGVFQGMAEPILPYIQVSLRLLP